MSIPGSITSKDDVNKMHTVGTRVGEIYTPLLFLERKRKEEYNKMLASCGCGGGDVASILKHTTQHLLMG